jgi:hypothetical protein
MYSTYLKEKRKAVPMIGCTLVSPSLEIKYNHLKKHTKHTNQRDQKKKTYIKPSPCILAIKINVYHV